MFGKPDVPDNCFTMSMIPWVSFEGFNLNLLFIAYFYDGKVL